MLSRQPIERVAAGALGPSFPPLLNPKTWLNSVCHFICRFIFVCFSLRWCAPSGEFFLRMEGFQFPSALLSIPALLGYSSPSLLLWVAGPASSGYRSLFDFVIWFYQFGSCLHCDWFSGFCFGYLTVRICARFRSSRLGLEEFTLLQGNSRFSTVILVSVCYYYLQFLLLFSRSGLEIRRRGSPNQLWVSPTSCALPSGSVSFHLAPRN